HPQDHHGGVGVHDISPGAQAQRRGSKGNRPRLCLGQYRRREGHSGLPGAEAGAGPPDGDHFPTGVLKHTAGASFNDSAGSVLGLSPPKKVQPNRKKKEHNHTLSLEH
ncbi:unnamed protein product, partial [Ascophyllum nodosum]